MLGPILRKRIRVRKNKILFYFEKLLLWSYDKFIFMVQSYWAFKQSYSRQNKYNQGDPDASFSCKLFNKLLIRYILSFPFYSSKNFNVRTTGYKPFFAYLYSYNVLDSCNQDKMFIIQN